ncbi:MAG: HlyC/CorC family transporter [Lachnospiraceae bacterium]|nr:HlyC/CorC family transporter [Lachnospiraceae bacterium]
MDPDSRLSIAVVFFFIASAYFALTETAVASVSHMKIRVRADKGDQRAERTLYVLDHFDDAITTLLICTNIAHIAAASIVTVLVTRRWGLSAVTLSTFAVTLAMFFLGEMLPKSIGKKASEKCSLACSGLLLVLMKVLRPATRVLTFIGNTTLKLVKSEDEYSVTEDELYDIIEDMEEEGAINEEQSELISSAIQFADVTVSSILTPRVDMAAVDVNDSPAEILKYIQSQNHSRILVYEKTVDNIIGVLQIRKFLKKYVTDREIPEVRPLMDEVYFAHQSQKIDELLQEMTKRKLSMAVITDSYGGTLGIATVEDILEEIVGEIWDEDDEIREPIVKLAESSYLVNGDETVLDTFDYIGFEEPDPENEERFTNLLMADWFYEQFTHIPERGESFTYHNLRITVSEIAHNRIYRLYVEVLPTEDGKEEDR